MKKIALFCAIALTIMACKKEEEPEIPTKLLFEVEFDETLPRLGNFGESVEVGEGNAAQHPNMREISMHYIEFAKDSLTPLTTGEIVYKGPETTAGGENAVNFNFASKASEGEPFLSMDLSSLAPGTYKWIRVSFTYQKYDIQFRYNDPPFIDNMDFTGTLASFVGFNTYITLHQVKDLTVVVNDDKLQGYWAFETSGEVGGYSFGSVTQGDGAGVTVVNPIAATSPVPPGSCVVTGKFAEPLVITGNETDDVKIVLALSINNSLEWEEVHVDGKFEPGAGETVVDMGLRGLHPRRE